MGISVYFLINSVRRVPSGKDPVQHLSFVDFFLILLFLAVLGLCGCASFSLAVVSRGYSPALLCGLLAELASLVAEHGP